MRPWLLVVAAAAIMLAGCSTPTAPGGNGGTPARERPFESPVIFAGDSWTYTFTKTGDQPYMCHPHTWMTGIVHVVPAGQPAMHNVTIDIYQRPNGDMGYDPKNVTVQVGEPVRWVNSGHASHSLMGDGEMTE